MTLKRQKINILGVDVDDIDQKNALKALFSLASDKKGHHMAVTINAEFVMLARRNKQFADILRQADLALPDGWPVAFSKLFFGGKEHERVTGVDLVEKVCSESANGSVRIGFLGGFHDVAKAASERQKAKNPGLKIVLAEPGDPAIGYDLRLRKRFLAIGRVDFLFVAYGMGRQEFFIKRNIGHLDVGVAMGVGGAFDYLSTVKMRAPSLMQRLGLEWLWRLLMEPIRIWRMRVLPLFLILVTKQWILSKF